MLLGQVLVLARDSAALERRRSEPKPCLWNCASGSTRSARQQNSARFRFALAGFLQRKFDLGRHLKNNMPSEAAALTPSTL